jgi:hypothetical protein
MKKIKHSFGTIYNEMTGETFIEVEDVAEILAKNWGDIPKYINDTRAMELHLLGKAYLSLIKKLNTKHLSSEKR